MSGTEKLLEVVFNYRDKMAVFDQELAEERRQHRARIEILNRSLNADFSKIEQEFESFFKEADFEDFASWSAAGPIYAAAWNNSRVSEVFIAGFRHLVEEQDTYINARVVPLLINSSPRARGGAPMVNMTVKFPPYPDKDKLLRSAKLSEILFAPMLEGNSSHYITLVFPAIMGSGRITKSVYQGADYDVHSPSANGGENPVFSGTMINAFEHIAKFMAPAGILE